MSLYAGSCSKLGAPRPSTSGVRGRSGIPGPKSLASATIPSVETPFLRRLVFTCVVLVLLFAVVFTWGDVMGIWPEAPSPVFRNTDLVAGFVLVAFFAFAAIRARRRE